MRSSNSNLPFTPAITPPRISVAQEPSLNRLPAQGTPSRQTETKAQSQANRQPTALDRTRFFRNILGAAAHPIGTATQLIGTTAHLAGMAADQLGTSALPRMLAGVEQTVGLPVDKASRAAFSAVRMPLQILAQWRPQAGFPEDAPHDIMSHIADHLDRKTLTNFAQAHSGFAHIAGGAVRDLSFRGPSDLREGLQKLGEDGMARFAERGLHSLSLTHSQFSRADIESIPAWMRDSVRTLHLDAPLANDAWPCLAAFGNLREVRVAQLEGMDASDLARLPATLHKLHLRMPLAPETAQQLERFHDLKEVSVTVASDARLDEVLAQFDAAPDTAADIKRPLEGIALTGLKVSQGGATAKALQQMMKLPLESLDMPLKGASLDTVLAHPTLRELRCAASELDATDAKKIAASKSLTKVELPYNEKIGDQGIRALVANQRIQNLDIGRCGGSDRLILDLHKRRPTHLNRLKLEA